MATISASMFTALDGDVDPGVGNWRVRYSNVRVEGAMRHVLSSV